MKFSTLLSLFLIAFIANVPQISAQSNVSISEDSSVSTSATIDFKITTLNSEWLSCSTQDPADDKLQITNIAKVITAINPDVVALQEVGTSSSYATIDTLVKKLGTAWAGKIVPWSADNCDQNQGIIYKKAKVQLVNSSLITNGGSYSNWSSGRYPALYNLSFTVSANNSVAVSLINIHAKAMSDETSYNKRKAASEGLKILLDGSSYNTKNVMVIGDFNDYLIGTQCATMTDSPFKNFMDDATNYKGLTSGLYDPSYSSPVIDNVIISNELFPTYVTNSATRETTATATVSSYKTTTSDHTPISTTFRFTIPTAVSNLFEKGEISLYPNPAHHYLTIKSDLNIEYITIYNLTGSEVINANNTTDKIDVSQLPQGIYIVKLKTEKGYYQQKLLKY